MFRYVDGTDSATGRPRRRTVTIRAKNKTAAQAKARNILAEAGDAPTGTTASMSQLLDEWMTFQSRRGRSPTTLNGYRSLIDHHIKDAIGATKIGSLTPHQLDSLYGECSRHGLSPRTVRNIHNVISAALNQGVRWGWLEKNPAIRATLPNAKPLVVRAPTPKQARDLIAACQSKDEDLGAFVFLAAVTGCRRGEIAALRWSSFHDGLLTIGQSAYKVKGEAGIKSTKAGRERTIHVDLTVQEWLNFWRRRCESRAREWGVKLASDGFIISSSPDGARLVSLDSVSREVRKVAMSLGMRNIHLHSLRHFAATEMLAAGITPRDAADMLGHADPSLTLRTYSHATTERQRAAASVLAGIITNPEKKALN